MRQVVLLLFFSLSFISHHALAADSASNRDNTGFGLDVGYAPVSLPLPGTKSATVYYNLSSSFQLGFEYTTTTLGLSAFSFEIGEIKEYNRGLKARYFPGNSFNWILGYGRRDTQVKLPGDLFDLVTHDYNDVLTHTRTEYAQLGFGNQWQWDNGMGLNIDWLTINIPVKAEITTSADRYTDNPDDAREVRRMESTIAWYPQLWLFQFKVGFTF